ncbi:phage portal protein, partial [Salmonella enterica subsp. enterica serovar Typhimurium]|uniref:hypothetical protein n=1 Tax=Salmonella enterica TaxID=28901 RepID=UPI000CBA25C4
YKSFNNKTFAVVPQQKGVDGYTEHSSGGNGPAVDEIEKVKDGFLSKIAMALGIPFSMLKGDMADVEKQTRNY